MTAPSSGHVQKVGAGALDAARHATDSLTMGRPGPPGVGGEGGLAWRRSSLAPRGSFLVVEGSPIHWAGHDDDEACTAAETGHPDGAVDHLLDRPVAARTLRL